MVRDPLPVPRLSDNMDALGFILDALARVPINHPAIT